MSTDAPADACDPALIKIVNVMGRERAQPVIDDTMRRAGLRSLATADDRYRFACALMTQGGVCEAIGRAIKIQAILGGAKET
jgi:hypothetical protein